MQILSTKDANSWSVALGLIFGVWHGGSAAPRNIVARNSMGSSYSWKAPLQTLACEQWDCEVLLQKTLTMRLGKVATEFILLTKPHPHHSLLLLDILRNQLLSDSMTAVDGHRSCTSMSFVERPKPASRGARSKALLSMTGPRCST